MSNINFQLPLVESPFLDKDLAKLNLSKANEELIRKYAEDGYIIFDPQISNELIDEAVNSIKPLFESEGTNRLQDAWKNNESIRKIASAPRVLELLKLLYQRDPIPFQTLNFSTGSQQRTHSDSIHFNSVPERYMAGVWVALEDVHYGNGPLHYYPGSHKLPFYDLSVLGIKGSQSGSMEEMITKYYSKYEDFVEELVQYKKLDKKILNLKKGQALIWSANLLHGGEKITQIDSSRFTQVNHFYFADCAYYRPMKTDMTLERISIQEVYNIATGKIVKSKYLGTEINHVGYSYKLYLPNQILRKIIPENVRGFVKNLLHR